MSQEQNSSINLSSPLLPLGDIIPLIDPPQSISDEAVSVQRAEALTVRKPGNPIVLTEEKCRQALALTRGNIQRAADALGVTRMGLKKAIRRYDLFPFIDELRQISLDFVESKLWEHIEAGSERSIHFFLERQGVSRGWNKKTEFKGQLFSGSSASEQIETTLQKSSDAELIELIKMAGGHFAQFTESQPDEPLSDAEGSQFEGIPVAEAP